MKQVIQSRVHYIVPQRNSAKIHEKLFWSLFILTRSHFPKIFSPSFVSNRFEQILFHLLLLLLLSNELFSKFSQSSKSNSAFYTSTSKLTATSRLGFISCLLFLQLGCRFPVFWVETWPSPPPSLPTMHIPPPLSGPVFWIETWLPSHFRAWLWQRTSPRLSAKQLF